MTTPPRRHQFLVSDQKFDVDYNYEPQKALGCGAYGIVCSALDKRYDRKVAIKKCCNAFDDLVDGKRILREIKLLQAFDHDNICTLLDMIPPAHTSKFQDVYMVLHFMESDLHKIIYSKNRLTEEHHQYFIHQILSGLRYIHSMGVVHRDLKPSNLLVNSNCELKICDFGLARCLSDKSSNRGPPPLTEYVVTRWYRAPEIMCSSQGYDEKIDMWSVGTILAEMVRRKPLFAGDHYIEQLNLIFDLLGTPQSDQDLSCVSNLKALKYIRKLPKKEPSSFQKKFGDKHNASKKCIDLLKRMLKFNPKDRLSVSSALKHPWLKALQPKRAKKESSSSKKQLQSALDWSWEDRCEDRSGLRAEMLKTCLEVRRKADKKWKKLEKKSRSS